MTSSLKLFVLFTNYLFSGYLINLIIRQIKLSGAIFLIIINHCLHCLGSQCKCLFSHHILQRSLKFIIHYRSWCLVMKHPQLNQHLLTAVEQHFPIINSLKIQHKLKLAEHPLMKVLMTWTVRCFCPDKNVLDLSWMLNLLAGITMVHARNLTNIGQIAEVRSVRQPLGCVVVASPQEVLH